ncbi:DUF5017 domain-containing protein [Pseudopedobacter beijingensis]|uniref:DUF5017 domain-containing protein n=1 Tax=Pseudopedobacter beijingensis TaxID=1207056 RepID=A0ABW4IGT0_9SPHI
MKKIFIISLISWSLFSACQKDVKPTSPTTDIKISNARSIIGDTLVFKLGDTCKFEITGYSDNITFWNGAAGNRYINHQRNHRENQPVMSFTSTAANSTQTNTLQVLATTKLKSRDSVTVINAPWTDITSRFALATSATAVNSGSVNLTDLMSNGNDSLLIAFKYMGKMGSIQPTWTISNLVISGVATAEANQTLLSLENDSRYWTVFANVRTPANARWVASNTALTIVGGAATQPDNTSWILSKSIFVNVTSPDVPTAIVKNVTSSLNNNIYVHKYAQKGVYKASFICFGTTTGGSKSKIIEFNIKVTD